MKYEPLLLSVCLSMILLISCTKTIVQPQQKSISDFKMATLAISITDSPYSASSLAEDNTIQIQSALDNAGEIYIPNGTFRVKGILKLKSNTIFYGPGILLYMGSTDAPLLSLDTISNVRISDLTIDGNSSKVTGAITKFGLIDIRGGASLIYHDITVSNVKIKNGYDYGIEADHVSRLTVINSSITDFGITGINDEFCQDNQLLNNYIDGKSTQNITGLKGNQGIETWGRFGTDPSIHYSQNHVISGNIVRNVSGGGIWTSSVDNTNLLGNVVSNCDDVGIDIENSYYCTISGNTVYNCINGDISTFFGSRNIAITGNHVRQEMVNFGAAIFIHGSGVSSSINVSGNDIYSKYSPGIFNDDAALVNSSISSNTIVCESQPGIELNLANKMSVNSNKITVGLSNIHSVNTGISIRGGSDGIIYDNSITSLFDNSGSISSSPDRGGVHLYYIDINNRCQRNIVKSNQISGFVVSINDNCWNDNDRSSHNYIFSNAVNSIYVRNSPGYLGKVENNTDINYPISIIGSTLY